MGSWVESANEPDCDFPIENLPFGQFRLESGLHGQKHIGVAIGSQILNLSAVHTLVEIPIELHDAVHLLSMGEMNGYMSLPSTIHCRFREWLMSLLEWGSKFQAQLQTALVDQSAVTMELPCFIHDYTDFYASINHATTVGKMLRPTDPLAANYKWVPVGYHGRASSLRPSGVPIQRPIGQTRAGEGKPPHFQATRRLDFELELGIFIGKGNAIESTIPIAEAEEHFFGMCLLNDWSARDIQGWEAQPLGPFLGKNFATTISPWIVTREALEPFRVAWNRHSQDPQPLEYLNDARNREQGGIEIHLEVQIETQKMRDENQPPYTFTSSEFSDAAYWTVAQLIAHHASNGCNLSAGDLMGTGTLSGSKPENAGSLLELSNGGKNPITLPNGELRSFVEDGDQITMKAYCQMLNAVRIGFGECSNRIKPAPTPRN